MQDGVGGGRGERRAVKREKETQNTETQLLMTPTPQVNTQGQGSRALRMSKWRPTTGELKEKRRLSECEGTTGVGSERSERSGTGWNGGR